LAAALAATTGAQALATLAVFVLPVLAPAAAPDLGVPARWVGYQVAAVYLPAALVSALAGGALRRLGPARATMLSSAEPLVSILFAAAVLGERLGPLQWAGAALVVVALALFEAADRGRRAEG
jgi:drug/metabolite transporter (DMT)-like permease